MNSLQRAFAAAAASVAFATPAFAHDFWLQPEAWQVAPQAEDSLTLQVGHGPDRQRSTIRNTRITRFEAVAPDGATLDLREGLVRDAGRDAVFHLPTPGTWLLVLETDNNAQSRLPAARFNEYLKTEGVTPALAQREREGRTNAEGSERYSRRTKALVQVGAPAASDAFATPVGLPLEIVLERNPHAQPRGTTLPVRVFHRGAPLAGALVKLTDLAHDAVPFEMHLSDAEGRARFTMPKDGAWLVNVIWTEPQAPGGEVEFETFFSSLSFGLTGSGSMKAAAGKK